MFPSTSTRRSTATEATKPQAAAPNFVLSLLAACSSSVPAAGKEGEATLSEQLSNLLQDKPVDVGELNLIYSYRFGLSIDDALKFIGFDGKLEDFAIKQKCFSILEGRMSLTPVDVPIQEELPAVDEPAAPEDCAKDVVDEAEVLVPKDNSATVETRSSALDSDSDVDIPGWHGVGSRLATALGSPEQQFCDEAPSLGEHNSWPGSALDGESDVDIPSWRGVGSRLATVLGSPEQQHCCDETASNADTESTDEGQSDAESDIDVTAWGSVGSRLVAALGSPDRDCWEADVDSDAWKKLGSRIAGALSDDPDEDVVDAERWRDVSSRIAAACKVCSDDEGCEDSSPDVAEWHAVGARVLQCFEDSDRDEH